MKDLRKKVRMMRSLINHNNMIDSPKQMKKEKKQQEGEMSNIS